MTKTFSYRIEDLLPSHLVESYPYFVLYLKGYYEWLQQDDNPYGAISNHLDAFNLKASIEEYTNLLKEEYLHNIPNDVLFDKELFIKWSKKFNSSRGSRQSIQFLFNVLFGEDVEIFTPKDYIFKASDATWISDEQIIYAFTCEDISDENIVKVSQFTTFNNQDYLTAEAKVRDIKKITVSKYNVYQIKINSINGSFVDKKTIKTNAGTELLLVNVQDTCSILNAGSGFEVGESLIPSNMNNTYEISFTATQDRYVNIFVDHYFSNDEYTVFVNNVVETDYVYNNGVIDSTNILDGDVVKVRFPSFVGSVVISQVDNNGSILEAGENQTFAIMSDSTIVSDTPMNPNSNGSSGIIACTFAPFRDNSNYHLDSKGHASDIYYLQDSEYYQAFSYVIKTEQDISKYKDILYKTVHAAGTKLFGNVCIIGAVQALINIVDGVVEVAGININILHKYGLGPTYAVYDKVKETLSKRVWTTGSYEEFTISLAATDSNYNLYDYGLVARGLHGLTISQQDSFGYMTKSSFADFVMHFDQDYTNYDGYSQGYFEHGYSTENGGNFYFEEDYIDDVPGEYIAYQNI